MKKVIALTLFFTFLFFPASAFAKIGVGVATGKIQVQDKLKPGLIYNLPPLTVINTGDVPSDYEVDVTYYEKQTQLKPPNDWFIFSPQRFHLEPGRVQVVNIKLNLPIMVTPGDYFGFLEAQPVQKDTAGKTTIGIAAATKLNFTLVPANIFYGLYYKIISIWEVYAPWPQRVVIAVVLIGALLFAKKFLNIQIGLKKPQPTPLAEEEMQKPLVKKRQKTVNKLGKIKRDEKESNDE
jgi:hypothetical protein